MLDGGRLNVCPESATSHPWMFCAIFFNLCKTCFKTDFVNRDDGSGNGSLFALLCSAASLSDSLFPVIFFLLLFLALYPH